MTDVPLVLVYWRDSTLSSPWEPLDADMLQTPLLCESVGYLVHTDDEVTIVAPHVAHHQQTDDTCGTMFIPTECITYMVDLTMEVDL